MRAITRRYSPDFYKLHTKLHYKEFRFFLLVLQNIPLMCASKRLRGLTCIVLFSLSFQIFLAEFGNTFLSTLFFSISRSWCKSIVFRTAFNDISAVAKTSALHFIIAMRVLPSVISIISSFLKL